MLSWFYREGDGNQEHEFTLLNFHGGMILGWLVVIANLFQLFLQIAFSATLFLRLIPVFAKGFRYIVFVQLIISYDAHISDTLDKQTEAKKYG